MNSARFAFTNRSGSGTLTGALLALDREDTVTPPWFHGFDSVFDFDISGFTFDTFDLTILYDAAAAGTGEGRLGMFHFVNGSWVEVPFELDTVNNRITALGLTSFSQFAVGTLTEPSAGLLLALGSTVLLRRRRVRC